MLRLILSLLFITQFSFCNWNQTILTWDYWPGETCDTSDKWNQSKFGGLELSLLELIMKNTGWNRSNIAYHCIYSDGDANAPYLRPNKYTDYIATFDGWVLFDHMASHSYKLTQPYHEITFGVGVLYEKPPWIFFQNFDYKIMIALFLIPIAIGILFKFINSKLPRIYQVSDHYGLIFFLPDYIEKRNASAKIISLAIKLLSLVVFGIFTSKLQDSLNDMKTFGGRTMDNGLFRVKAFTEKTLLFKVLSTTLIIPKSYQEFWMNYEVLEEKLNEYPGQTFIANKVFLELLLYKYCSLYYIGDIFKIYNVFTDGLEPENMRLELNTAILDTIEFRNDYVIRYDYESLVPADDIKCKPSKTQKEFRYSIIHINELWFVYVACIGISFLYRITIECTSFKKWNLNPKNFRDNRVKNVIDRVKDNFHQSFMWLQIYNSSFKYPVFVERLRKARNLINAKNPQLFQSLSQTRAAVVRKYLKLRKRIRMKILIKRLIFVTKLEEIKNLTKNNFYMKSLKVVQKHFPRKRHNEHYDKKKRKYYIKIIKESLKENLLKSFQHLNICGPIRFCSKIEKYSYNHKFAHEILIKLKGDHLAKYKFQESAYSHINEIFFQKTTQNILRYFSKGEKNFRKTRMHKSQIIRLIKLNYQKEPSHFYTEIMSAIMYINSKKQNYIEEFPPNVGPTNINAVYSVPVHMDQFQEQNKLQTTETQFLILQQIIQCLASSNTKLCFYKNQNSPNIKNNFFLLPTKNCYAAQKIELLIFLRPTNWSHFYNYYQAFSSFFFIAKAAPLLLIQIVNQNDRKIFQLPAE